MIEEINSEAFEFIKRIKYKPIEIQSNFSELVGSSKEKGFIDWTDKIVGDTVETTTDFKDNTIEIFLSDENGSYGFEGANYLIFTKFIKNLYSIEELSQKVSLSFIESESFNWIMSAYKKQRVDNYFYDYLIAKLETVIKPYTFLFPVLNLEIEKSFIIGNVEFTFLTKEYFDNLYKTLKSKDDSYTPENFQQFFRKDFQGQVLAKVTVIAENNKAEEIAKENAEIAVDVLKLYSDSAIIPERKTMFDLNYRLSYQEKSNFLTQNQNEKLTICVQFSNERFNFTQNHYSSAYDSGLKIFSDFISKRNNDELYEIIIQSIQLFGTAISNWDLHLRCVNLITILESIFLKEDEEYKIPQKTKARLSKALTIQNKEKERIRVIFSNIYEIRHKMIHNAKRIEINTKELSEVQNIMINLFLRLIEFNTKNGFFNKSDLIDKLDEIKN